jgi:large conductance mechanosensitive channel
MKKFVEEFKTFITRGNVMDLAVAFIIGAAFKAIIGSLVKDIIMPVVSLVVGPEGFNNYKYVITEAVYDLEGVLVTAENAILYGSFIQSVVDFLIIAFVVFLMIKSINKAKRIAEEAKDMLDGEEEEIAEEVPVVPAPTIEEILLDIKAVLEKKE